MKSMRPDYKNWVPKGMLYGLIAGTAVTLVFWILFGIAGIGTAGTLKTVLAVTFGIVSLVLLAITCWVGYLYSSFSYNGSRQISRKVVEGIAGYVELPEGGVGLDVGCGSGALTIACAKRSPQGSMVGVDRWGKEYASYNLQLCEDNAQAEGVGNVVFQKGDATALPFEDETFDVVTSNYVYHNIVGADKQALILETLRTLKKGGAFAIHDLMTPRRYGDIYAFADRLRTMGYERVEILDTTDGLFLPHGQAALLGLEGSKLLIGRK